jgi:endoribonuclease LACTB2
MSEALEGVPAMPVQVARPRDAAVAVLYRRVGQGVEVFWLKREKTLRFGGGFYAFPGGKVDAADASLPVVGLEGAEARLVIAAARELFEEAGVLKAAGAERLGQATLDELRRGLLGGTLAFGRLLSERGLEVRAEDFPPAGRWLTPPTMPIRFDARFYLVECPADQAALVWPGELESGEWITPQAALQRWAEATALLHPPALHCLQVLADFRDQASAARAMAANAFLDADHVTHRVEFQRGLQLMPLLTATLPPATHTTAYVLGTGECLVVDPGATDDAEAEKLVALLQAQPALRPRAVVLTHHHGDHVGGAGWVARRLGVPVWAHAETARRVPVPVARLLVEDEVLELDGPWPMRWRVLHTPGHAPGHLTLVDEATRSAVVGDMVAGVGTIVIDPADGGDMAEYLRQLERLKALVRAVYPAHGNFTPDGPGKLEEYLVHRRWREGKVLEALRAQGGKAATLEALVPLAYDDVASFVWPIAERNIHAILLKLAGEGVAAWDGEGWRLA